MLFNRFSAWLARQSAPPAEKPKRAPRVSTLSRAALNARKAGCRVLARHDACRHRSITSRWRCRRCGRKILLHGAFLEGFEVGKEGRPLLLLPYGRRQPWARHSWLSGYFRGRKSSEKVQPVFEKSEAA